MKSINLLSGFTSPGAGPAEHPTGNNTIQATVTGTGAVAASIDIQVSNDNQNWLWFDTITLSGANQASDGFAFQANWVNIRAKLNSISGTGAIVNVVMGGV